MKKYVCLIKQSEKGMKFIMDKEGREELRGEDVTKYGEFISSYFAWVSPEQQKNTVEKLENITKNEKE